MPLRRGEYPILAFNIAYLVPFSWIAWRSENHEFLMYVGVVLVIMAWILIKQVKVRFGRAILWGLSIWGLLHMAGGNIEVRNDVLYDLQLIPVVLRFDQLVHFLGFGTVTLVCHHVLRPHLRAEARMTFGLFVLIVLMGCGVGAFNEIVEFAAVGLFPETNVGGYGNTLWDLTFNFLGAVTAGLFIILRGHPETRES